ncbi:hypothetical protein [Wolbachia endosymbiont (group A) of Cydia splendana]|nr:hypothetical protein [Wolbachia endosymbiont (group A) of Cydia splendana]
MLLKSFKQLFSKPKAQYEMHQDQEEEWQPITYSLIALKLWKQTVTE